MGGTGSGTWYRWNTKTTVDDCRVLNINAMVKKGAIPKCGYRSGGWRWTDTETGEEKASISYEVDTRDPENSSLRLYYTLTQQDIKIDYKIPLNRTKAHYGGERLWFICPVKRRRVSKLYLPPGGDIFASRYAYSLSYKSQSENDGHRMIRRMWKLKNRLGGEDFYIRPKGMHNKTHKRIMEQVWAAEEVCEYYLISKFSKLL